MAAETADLERSIREGDEYIVVGIIMPVKQRYADAIRAASPMQAEDLARANIKGEVHNGQHGDLWVAGVLEVVDGSARMADDYACFVDPDEVRTDT